MQTYLLVVMFLNFLVDLLLLMGTNRMCGYPVGFLRCLAASVPGGIYAGVCLIPGFGFLGDILWRSVFLLAMVPVAFGISLSALKRGAVFFLLTMALGGISLGLGDGGSRCVVASAAGIFLLCAIGFHDRPAAGLVPVELQYGGRNLRILALRDTGNTLHDPVTGQPVLVAGPDVAGELLGLTAQQLRHPVESLPEIPGARLIPYRTVGQSGSLLLCVRLPHVRIGDRNGSYLVAFAPELLDRKGTFQALTGGNL